ncbi:MAG: hypothetical protein AMQ74_00649 [Candidatus Methanofastidiosum methylothiophilum]|uniref:Uncharacterized protein n=1 Tax=Candidatus Methanofastidiosum methylothiophilum TaxID=1705564 RepID=A0A150J651_9EURY|nr:MAG: hypothetical protein AMQ74_00649 [Candidatus Methanofastidiosum methylthiophilus]
MGKISKNRTIGIIVISLLAISTFPVILSEEIQNLGEDALYARYMTYHQRKETAVIAMDAIIKLYDEKGISTTELVSLKIKLNDLDSKAKIAAVNTKRDEFYSIIKESREVIKYFREITQEKEVEGQKDVVKAALEENKNYLLELRAETSTTKKGIYLKAVDNRLEKLEQISLRLEEKGADVSEINAKIDEISSSRAKISDESDRDALKEFHQSAKEDVQQLREMIKKAIEEIKEQNN